MSWQLLWGPSLWRCSLCIEANVAARDAVDMAVLEGPVLDVVVVVHHVKVWHVIVVVVAECAVLAVVSVAAEVRVAEAVPLAGCDELEVVCVDEVAAAVVGFELVVLLVLAPAVPVCVVVRVDASAVALRGQHQRARLWRDLDHDRVRAACPHALTARFSVSALPLPLDRQCGRRVARVQESRVIWTTCFSLAYTAPRTPLE